MINSMEKAIKEIVKSHRHTSQGMVIFNKKEFMERFLEKRSLVDKFMVKDETKKDKKM
jgi:hypothetical protein